VEKFRVVNRDDLADGLEANWEKFTAISNRYAPDILDFLLHLSHDPVKSLPFAPIQREAAANTPNLTWAEILQDDPYSDEELWEREEFSESSSGNGSEEETDVKTPSSDKRERAVPVSPTQSHLIFVDDYEKYKRRRQFWKELPQSGASNPNPVILTELDVIRETIHMLRGLSTSIYKTGSDGTVRCVPGYAIKLISSAMLDSVVSDFAAFGTILRRIRAWTVTTQDRPLNQAIHSALEAQIRVFDSRLDMIETQYTNNEDGIPTSLMGVLDEVTIELKPMLRFERMMQILDQSNSDISSLSALYSRTIREQLAKNDAYHRILAKIFLAAFRVYLKPVQIWMETGELTGENASFFIIEKEVKSQDTSVWHDQVALRKPNLEQQVLPIFMANQTNKILNSGKSVRFLKRLGYNTGMFNFSDAPQFTVEEICDFATELELFEARFLETLDKWVQTKYKPSSSLLRNILIKDFGLFRNLDALRAVFLLPDGDITQSVFYPVFDALDRKYELWNDQYLLQERLQHAFQDSQYVEPTSISVRSSTLKTVFQSVKAINSINVDLQVNFRPLAN
jgi:gamma-tubulin complex component 5